MKLTEKIHLLQIDFQIPISPEKKLSRFVNAVIIFGKKIVLIDTGVKGSEDKIFSYIEGQCRSAGDIETVILSHSHPDHIGAAAAIKERTGCRVLAHEREIEWIEDIEKQNGERPVPWFHGLVDRPCRVDGVLENGQVLDAVGGVTMEIIHAPGHSKGSLNILFKEDRILFTADSIPLKNDIPNYDNFHEAMKTIENIKKNAGYSILLTSWTPPLYHAPDMERLMREGEEYLLKIDNAVKETYRGMEAEPLLFCRKTLEKLGLPSFLATPLVDKAFRSH